MTNASTKHNQRLICPCCPCCPLVWADTAPAPTEQKSLSTSTSLTNTSTTTSATVTPINSEIAVGKSATGKAPAKIPAGLIPKVATKYGSASYARGRQPKVITQEPRNVEKPNETNDAVITDQPKPIFTLTRRTDDPSSMSQGLVDPLGMLEPAGSPQGEAPIPDFQPEPERKPRSHSHTSQGSTASQTSQADKADPHDLSKTRSRSRDSTKATASIATQSSQHKSHTMSTSSRKKKSPPRKLTTSAAFPLLNVIAQDLKHVKRTTQKRRSDDSKPKKSSSRDSSNRSPSRQKSRSGTSTK